MTAPIKPQIGDFIEIWGDTTNICWGYEHLKKPWKRVRFPIVDIQYGDIVVLSIKNTQYEKQNWPQVVSDDVIYKIRLTKFDNIIPSGRRCVRCRHE